VKVKNEEVCIGSLENLNKEKKLGNSLWLFFLTSIHSFYKYIYKVRKLNLPKFEMDQPIMIVCFKKGLSFLRGR
jgi:hypothetical protein